MNVLFGGAVGLAMVSIRALARHLTRKVPTRFRPNPKLASTDLSEKPALMRRGQRTEPLVCYFLSEFYRKVL